MMPWRRKNSRAYSENNAAAQMNTRFPSFCRQFIAKRPQTVRLGGYQMFVEFVCFVRFGFILTPYSSESNYASVLCDV